LLKQEEEPCTNEAVDVIVQLCTTEPCGISHYRLCYA